MAGETKRKTSVAASVMRWSALSVAALDCLLILGDTSTGASLTNLVSAGGIAQTPRVAAPGVPTKLQLPALSLNSPIVSVGTIRGEIATPCDPNYPLRACNTNAAGWFDESVAPGVAGNAIIDGHELWYGAHKPLYVPAAFTHLYEAKVGDQVIVTDDKAQVWVFRVDKISILSVPKTPASFYSTGGLAALTLVTCNGVYNPKLHMLQNRVFVHATLVGEGRPSKLDAARHLIPWKQPYG